MAVGDGNLQQHALDAVTAEEIKTIAGFPASMANIQLANLVAYQQSLQNTMAISDKVWAQRMIEYQPVEAMADSRAGQSNTENQVLGLAAAVATAIALVSKTQEAPAPQGVPPTATRVNPA